MLPVLLLVSGPIQLAEADIVASAFSGNVEERELDALLEISGLSLPQDEIKNHLSATFHPALLNEVMKRLLEISQ